MQIEEAKDTIARLIREAIPAAGSPVPASTHTATGGINFLGGMQVVQIHVTQLPTPQPPANPVPAFDEPHPALAERRREILIRRLQHRSAAQGKPDLYQRFLRSVYSTSDLKMLDEHQLARALRWLEDEAGS